MRLQFEQFGILLALIASGRAEDLFTQVGGAAFDANKRILAVCYNGFAPGQELNDDFLKNREEKNKFVFHSEQNLLAQVKKGEVDSLFLTHSPCENCSRLIAANGVKSVTFLQEYHRETNYKAIFDFYRVKYNQINKESLKNCIKFLEDSRNKLLENIWKE